MKLHSKEDTQLLATDLSIVYTDLPSPTWIFIPGIEPFNIIVINNL